MREILILVVAGSLTGAFLLRPDEQPTAQTVVNMPPEDLFRSLSPLYAEIERKSRIIQTVTGRPPVPVAFKFARVEGEMLSMSGTAGFRTVGVKAWIEGAQQPGQSVLKVQFEPASLLQKSGERDPHVALRKILQQTAYQFAPGKRITALFGGSAD
ncbi:MAG: hypothetical protein EOP13_08545 [Pseudomonas sp.]|uniref:hypothetical protein n=1 Tax=Pseudomonas sp. TaxID=306 RepID=UPI00121811F9|nr:hypothetical protein [Pseudomonas sp.]RZI74483.1 MAG: hypothetical protein EOP13_08545 [Pseudomonas sp.]